MIRLAPKPFFFSMFYFLVSFELHDGKANLWTPKMYRKPKPKNKQIVKVAKNVRLNARSEWIKARAM